MRKHNLFTYLLFLLAMACPTGVVAQDQTALLDGAKVGIELSGTVSSGEFAPLWLSSNRQGTVSPYGKSSYERVSLTRALQNDSMRQWRRGYCVDLQYSQNAQSNLFVQQAYFEVEWKKLLLTVGQKEREIDLRNNQLTSGGLSQGINARPIPEVLLNIDYFSIPGTHHWLKLRGRFGYGMTTDGSWQENWVEDKTTMRYTSNYLYHEKAGYLKVGKEDSSFPLVFEGGLQMFTQFGGKGYNVYGRGGSVGSVIKYDSDIKAFIDALFPFDNDGDVTDGTQTNVKGNMLGSLNMAVGWYAREWMVRGYFERFFEDHSQLLPQYGVYDHLLGIEGKLPENPFVSSIVIEHLSTKDQSGPVYHDATNTIPEQISAFDNYYNHVLYSGWQYYGMSMGTPLITSPIYNNKHTLHFLNNRVKAWHFGMSGNPSKEFSWRMLFTWTKNWGVYGSGWDPVIETHGLFEATYRPLWAMHWTGTLDFGYSHGEIIGNTTGVQLTIRKDIKL